MLSLSPRFAWGAHLFIHVPLATWATWSVPLRSSVSSLQVTNVDSVGHRRGASSGEYEDKLRDARQFVVELMGVLPPNSVLLVATDHGHEARGGSGGTSDVVSRTPLYSFRKTVAHGATTLELNELAAATRHAAATTRKATSDSSSENGDSSSDNGDSSSTTSTTSVTMVDDSSEHSMLDIAPTLALLSGLPVPRHAEGGFISRMFSNARREMWPMHARDLLYQRYHYAMALIEFQELKVLDRLRALELIEQDAAARIAASGSSPLEQAVSWLMVASEVQAAIDDAKATLANRSSLRNLGVTTALGLLILSLTLYVLHVMTFADLFFVIYYKRYAKSKHRTFWQLPDVIASAQSRS